MNLEMLRKIEFVFDTKKARESFEEIKNIYGLTSDRKIN